MLFYIAWTDDKLQSFVKLVLEDENYDDIGNGSDCGLFDLFPHLQNHVSIREVMEQDSEDDSVGSLADFIEDDLGEQDGESDEEQSSEEEDEDEDSVIDLDDSEDSEESEESEESDRRSKKRKVSSKHVEKRRKIIVIDSESDSDLFVCLTYKKMSGFL